MKSTSSFSTLTSKLEVAESDLVKAAIALENVNEINIQLESRLSQEIQKNRNLVTENEACKKELMVAYKALAELKKKLKGSSSTSQQSSGPGAGASAAAANMMGHRE